MGRARAWAARNAHPVLTPATVTRGSDARALWQCGAAGHLWTATINHRSHGRGCPQCHLARGTLREGLRGECVCVLRAVAYWSSGFCRAWEPGAAVAWGAVNRHATLTPATVAGSSGFDALWRCAAGHHWDAPVYDRSRGRGCLRCRRWWQARS